MRKLFLAFVVCYIVLPVFSQVNKKEQQQPAFTLMSYNVENLFDYFDDPEKGDNDFLPQSRRAWTKERYRQKLGAIAKVILSVGIEPPSFIALIEIENRKVLNDLVNETALRKFGYKIIHFESPDPRGIDVAAIYRPDFFSPITARPVRIASAKETRLQTRDILYTKGIAGNADTLHIFVNHWPSRRGGEKKSEAKRKLVANKLYILTDSIFAVEPQALITITGDFNDEPDNNSLTKVLKAHPFDSIKSIQKPALINLSYSWLKNSGFEGTYNFKGKWNILDHVIVSDALLNKKNKRLYTTNKAARIYKPAFLFVESDKPGVILPFKTYSGFKYTGGFSDHLPVIVDFYRK